MANLKYLVSFYKTLVAQIESANSGGHVIANFIHEGHNEVKRPRLVVPIAGEMYALSWTESSRTYRFGNVYS